MPNASASRPTLNELLARPAADLGAWAQAVRAGREPVEDGFNWRGLAFAAAAEARRAAERAAGAEARSWADVAQLGYERGGDRDDAGAMALRASLIRHLGPEAGDDLRDPAPVFAWFLRAVDGLSADEAAVRSSAAKTALSAMGADPREQARLAVALRPLRAIKERLGTIAVLAARSDVMVPPEITAWLAARDRLP